MRSLVICTLALVVATASSAQTPAPKPASDIALRDVVAQLDRHVDRNALAASALLMSYGQIAEAGKKLPCGADRDAIALRVVETYREQVASPDFAQKVIEPWVEQWKFTDEELQDLAAFFKTPAGQKYLSASRNMNHQMVARVTNGAVKEVRAALTVE